jgi:hypothetical protein
MNIHATGQLHNLLLFRPTGLTAPPGCLPSGLPNQTSYTLSLPSQERLLVRRRGFMEISDLLSEEDHRMARNRPGKSISFELLLDEGSKTRARIPLRVIVNHHDTTESVITTVKNFYGIYDGTGISFEDSRGNTLIASYENLDHDTMVYVRCVPGSSQPSVQFSNGQQAAPAFPEPQRRASLGEPFHMMLPPHMREPSHSPSRSSSRLARKRSASPPQMRGRRSASQQKAGSFSAMSRDSSASASVHEDGYSDSEAGRSSISGSRKARSELIASSDISTANVLQDGRRGQTIFDSSVSRTIPMFSQSFILTCSDSASIRPSSSANHCLAVIDLAAASLITSRGSLSLPASCAEALRNSSSPDVFSTELQQWLQQYD